MGAWSNRTMGKIQLTLSQIMSFTNAIRACGRCRLYHPPPASLHYRYPPPTTAILTNIMNALIAVPRFYIQVLHLMNKMNLPPPFGTVTGTPPLHVAAGTAAAREPGAAGPVGRDPLLASDESELESDTDEPAAKRPAHARARDAVRNPAVVAPPPVVVVPAPPSAGTKRARPVAELQPVAPPAAEPQPAASPATEPKPAASAANTAWQSAPRLSEAELRDLPAFKGYERGQPSDTLYIKNLARKVTLADLEAIFQAASADLPERYMS